MNHEPYGPPTAVTRPSRVRTTALSTAVPIALAIGAVFAAPIATGVPGGTVDRPHRSVNLAGDCASRTAHTRLHRTWPRALPASPSGLIAAGD